ncbi:spore germination YkwD domain-containing protein [Streptomyces mirabilis]|uniref:hypothetical protein n=1 Tax=Streptomyces mirabilis TaxID=68239 RepID=UPI0036D05FBC
MENPTLLHRRAATIVAAALSTGGTILTTGASATVSEVSPSDQQAIVSETNSVRRQAGQSPLTWDDSLAKAAGPGPTPRHPPRAAACTTRAVD